MNLQSKRWAAVATIFSGSILLAASAGQTRPIEPARAQPANQQRIGQITIEWGRMQTIWKKNLGITLDLINGPNGATNAQIKSKMYDMAAPRISLDVRKGSVHTGTATGGVRVEVRQDLIVDKKPVRRVTSLQGDNATYSAAVPSPEKGTPSKPAQIVIRGNVHGVMRSPEFSPTGPLDIAAESVVVKFIDAETITIDAENGKGSGTPLEREPKAKP